MLGVTLRRTMGAVPGLRTIDSAAGLVLGALAGLVLCWAVGAVLLYLPGQSELRRAVQESAILARINEEFPPGAPARDARAGRSARRRSSGRRRPCRRRTRRLARDPDVDRARSTASSASRGIACGLGVEGSGWIARRGLVVTNAHVVAGIERPRVDRGDGGGHRRQRRRVRRDERHRGAPRAGAPRGGRSRSRIRSAGSRSSSSAIRGTGRSTRIPGRLGGTSAFVEPGRVRARAGDADRDGDPGSRAAGALGRPGRRRARARAHDGLRAARRRAGRLRRSVRARPRARSTRGGRRGRSSPTARARRDASTQKRSSAASGCRNGGMT